MSEDSDDLNDDLTFLSSKRQKKAEVEALMRCHGWTLEYACKIVCYEPEEYLRSPPPPQSRIDFLPSPEQILKEAERLRMLRTEEPEDLV